MDTLTIGLTLSACLRFSPSKAARGKCTSAKSKPGSSTSVIKQGRMENFELIQMMNETTPNEISDDAVLVISASYSSVDNTYAHFLEKVQKSNEDSMRLPFYLLRKAKSILLQNSNEIKGQVDEISQVLEYFASSFLIKKVTVLAFEEGSLLALRSLNTVSYRAFFALDKLILINPFNPALMICHSNANSFIEDIKNSILKDEVRTQLVNNTRIVMISTVNTNIELGNSWTFLNEEGERVTFANSFMVSTRFLWNVYCLLKPHEYFKFQPFLWILTKMFNEDRANGPLSVQALRNLLLYRELPTVRELTVLSRNKILPQCVDFQLQNYKYDGDISNAQCIRFLRKQNYFFNQNTTIMIRAVGRFELYGQSYQKLSPFDTKTKETIYLMEKILQYRRFFVINRRRYNIHITLHTIGRPNSLVDDWLNQDSNASHGLDPLHFAYFKRPQPIMVCPGFTLIYPLNFMSVYHSFSSHLSLEFENLEEGCYPGNDYFMDWVQQLLGRWNIGLNLFVFTLFCSHVLKKSVFTRFYYQLLTNFTLCLLHTGDSLLAQNLLVLTAVVLFQLFLKCISALADMINMPKSFASKIMWSPLVFELLRRYDSDIMISPWKVIGVQFLAATHRTNIIILFLEFGFVLEHIVRDLPNFQSLFLLCAWLTVSATQQEEAATTEMINNLIIINTGKKVRSLKNTIMRLRRQMVDSLTVCIMGVCLSEDGQVFHYIIDFYIIAHVLFAAHQCFDEYI